MVLAAVAAAEGQGGSGGGGWSCSRRMLQCWRGEGAREGGRRAQSGAGSESERARERASATRWSESVSEDWLAAVGACRPQREGRGGGRAETSLGPGVGHCSPRPSTPCLPLGLAAPAWLCAGLGVCGDMPHSPGSARLERRGPHIRLGLESSSLKPLKPGRGLLCAQVRAEGKARHRQWGRNWSGRPPRSIPKDESILGQKKMINEMVRPRTKASK